MQFNEVVGQQEVKRKLAGMVNSGKIPHAMMLVGPEGNGGLALALAIAQFIQCENKQAEESCGACSSCSKSKKYVHPDVHFTFPVVKRKDATSGSPPPISQEYITEWRTALASNVYMNANDWLQNIGAENRQGNITVRECHEIIRGMSLKTYESGYKIQIIWLAEFLKEAGNTLLKVIEEPPANTIFILVVENIELVLNTVLSRNQIIKVNAIDTVDVKEALLKKFEIDEGAANRIARISDGNFNAALNMAGGEENANDKLLHRWLVCCFNLKQKASASNTKDLMDWIDEVAGIGRENQKIFLKYALFFLRECALISLVQKSEKLEGDELNFAQRLSARLSATQLETLSKILNRLHYHIERNANPKIVFVSNSFRIASVFKNEEVVVEGD
jgi:DNA polymerase-3 subunit delta'